MSVKKILYFVLVMAFCSQLSLSWTEDGKWESGSSITWDVPYQSQAYFRNWSTSCSTTSGAMIINFMYSGAKISQFSGTSHPWEPISIDTPYATTGQRVYALGTITGNDYNGNLSTYLRYYPKNGTYQYYCSSSSCTNANFGPLHNEKLSATAGVLQTVTSGGDTWGDLNNSLRPYLDNKHSIKIYPLYGNFITLIRDALYNGPVLVSVGRNNGSHIIVVKGVTSEGNFVVNDPWGSDIFSYPGNAGEGKIYEVLENGYLNAYGYNYIINSAYSIPVFDNFNRAVTPFSPWIIPCEAALKFCYDASGEFNSQYSGDGDYVYIRNGFNFWNSEAGEWKYFYNKGSALGFLYSATTQGNNATATACWIPYFPRSGRYRVLVGFLADSSNSSEVNYIVNHRDGQDTVTINQKNDTNAYEVRGNIVYKSLGNYYFDAGASEERGSVKIDNKSNVSGDINVDIIRFAYPPFPDINKLDWYYNYVLCLYGLGIVSGDSDDGHFRPYDEVTRAEFIKMVILALERSVGYGMIITYCSLPPEWKVDPNQWYYSYLTKAYMYTNANVFPSERIAFWNPNISVDFSKGVTREEAAHIVRNALNLTAYSYTGTVFTDVSPYSAYAQWIYKIREVGIINGYPNNTFQPTTILNRAEATKIIRNMLKYKGFILSDVCSSQYPDICAND